MVIMTATRPTLALRPYQQEAIDAVNDAELDGITRPLVALPTGTGKTVIFAHLLDQRPGRALVLAHRDELIRQAADKMLMVNPDFNIGIVKATENETGADVVVASVQTLSRANRLEQLYCNFNTIIVDEAHHGTADTYMRILEHVGAFAEGGPLTIGFTATPERGDKVGLNHVWERIVYRKDLLEMVLAGYLCDLRAIRVSLALDLDRVQVRGGDYVDGQLGRAMMDANAPQHVVAAYQEHAPGRKALVFTPTVKVAHEMARRFQQVGVAAEALDGTTPEDERRAILHRLHTGETMVVANCAVLTEGFDCPSVDCIIVARPTKSRPFYVQMIGRGTRVHPGKPDCLIIDCVGVSERHPLVTADSLVGKDLSNGVSLREAVERDDKLGSVGGGDDVGGRLVASMVDLFSNRGIHWQQTRQGAWILSLGTNGMLRMASDGSPDRWTVSVSNNGAVQVLKEGLPLGYAQGFAEDFARKVGHSPLLDPNAAWRGQEATEKQINTLRKWRVPVAPGLTKGAASDLLAAIFGDR